MTTAEDRKTRAEIADTLARLMLESDPHLRILDDLASRNLNVNVSTDVSPEELSAALDGLLELHPQIVPLAGWREIQYLDETDRALWLWDQLGEASAGAGHLD